MRAATLALGILVWAGTTAAETKTELSTRAGRVKSGMSRKEVIALLGPATWALLPGDPGEWAEALNDQPRDRQWPVVLQLGWFNGKCFPVFVDFNAQMKVTGSDDGLCISLTEPPNLGNQYSCTKSDRSAYCK